MRFARSTLALSLWTGLCAATAPAAASGPVERIVQVMPKPGKPDSLVVRYGVATHGFLYSEDAGKNFQASCVAMVDPVLAPTYDRINKITLRPIASTAAVAMDGGGRVMFSQYGSMYMSDGTGCGWSSIEAMKGRWPFSIKTDPADPNTVWAAVSKVENEGTEEATADVTLMRRGPTGAPEVWATAGQLLHLTGGDAVYDGDLIVYAREGKTRHYVTINVYGLKGEYQLLLVSDDAGASWKTTRLPAQYNRFNLLAVDPTNPDRVLAAMSADNQPDRLLISKDQGKTFTDYVKGLRGVSGVTFDPTGRVYIGDTGDATGEDTVGGLWTAKSLGEPLTKIADTSTIDCVHHDAQSGKLYVCQAEKFGIANPQTGAVQTLISLPTVPSILTCPGRDLVAECKEQLNDGPSWCCAGHFPFTPFCGQYDVTVTSLGRRVYCGKSGREYDSPPDAGVSESSSGPLALEQTAEQTDELDAPTRETASGSRVSAGCALGSESEGRGTLGILLSSLTVLLITTRRGRRRR